MFGDRLRFLRREFRGQGRGLGVQEFDAERVWFHLRGEVREGFVVRCSATAITSDRKYHQQNILDSEWTCLAAHI